MLQEKYTAVKKSATCERRLMQADRDKMKQSEGSPEPGSIPNSIDPRTNENKKGSYMNLVIVCDRYTDQILRNKPVLVVRNPNSRDCIHGKELEVLCHSPLLNLSCPLKFLTGSRVNKTQY